MTETAPATSVIPAGFDDLLTSKALANIATIGPKGEPQNSPVWFHWDGKHLRFAQTEGRQKLRNLRRDGRVAVSIVDLVNPSVYLEIRGRVSTIDLDSDRSFIRALSNKYLGDESFAGMPGDYVTIVIEPTHTTTLGPQPNPNAE